jgi:hypothetical protein
MQVERWADRLAARQPVCVGLNPKLTRRPVTIRQWEEQSPMIAQRFDQVIEAVETLRLLASTHAQYSEYFASDTVKRLRQLQSDCKNLEEKERAYIERDIAGDSR